MATVYVLNKFEPNLYNGVIIDTTSRGDNKDLSPFFLGPIQTYEPGVIATNVENLWQYSKVYPGYALPTGGPSDAYYQWRNSGWATQRAVRYPMGKGAKPLYSLWNGSRLGYIDARKIIYAPAYRGAVIMTQSYNMLCNAVMAGRNIVLRDFDGYDYIKMGMTLKDVINYPHKIMGHAFVLAMLLTNTFSDCIKT